MYQVDWRIKLIDDNTQPVSSCRQKDAGGVQGQQDQRSRSQENDEYVDRCIKNQK